MSDQLLNLLKFCLLALIYLFFFRVLRAVWAEITPPKIRPAPAGRGKQAKAPRPGKPPKVKVPKGGGPPVPGPAPGHPPSQLLVIEPAESRGRVYPLGEELRLGRAPGCQIIVDDTFVSQMHARVCRRDGNYVVEDLGSTNGTYLNRKKVSGAMIMQRGDRLQVGNTVLELE